VRIVVTDPDSSVLIDGYPYVRWPDTGPEVFLMPGKHQVSATKEGFVPYETSLEIKAGEQRDIMISLLREGDERYHRVMGIPRVLLDVDAKMGAPAEPPTWPTRVMIGGVAGLGLGGALLVTGLVKNANAKTEEDSELWQGVTIGGGIFACMSGVVLGIGVVGWATRPQPPQPVIIQPVITNQQTGFSASGHW
jgi:hypothetical protein